MAAQVSSSIHFTMSLSGLSFGDVLSENRGAEEINRPLSALRVCVRDMFFLH